MHLAGRDHEGDHLPRPDRRRRHGTRRRGNIDARQSARPATRWHVQLHRSGRAHDNVEDRGSVRCTIPPARHPGFHRPRRRRRPLRTERQQHDGPGDQPLGEDGELRWPSATYQRSVDLPGAKENGVACPDGTTAASTDTYAFDDVSLTGTHTSIHGDICGLQPAMTKTPFTLAFQGPLASPVDRYPLDCNEIGQCR